MENYDHSIAKKSTYSRFDEMSSFARKQTLHIVEKIKEQTSQSPFLRKSSVIEKENSYSKKGISTIQEASKKSHSRIFNLTLGFEYTRKSIEQNNGRGISKRSSIKDVKKCKGSINYYPDEQSE